MAETAIVLSGGGARGAYEVGALSVLLPVLEERGERPRIVIGTSVGAFNAAYIAANADRPLDEALQGGIGWWSTLRWRDVMAPLTSPRGRALAPLPRTAAVGEAAADRCAAAPRLAAGHAGAHRRVRAPAGERGGRGGAHGGGR